MTGRRALGADADARRPPTSTESTPAGLSLSRRFVRSCSRAEITAVGISPDSRLAFAIYSYTAAALTSQSWLDVLDLASRKSLSKTSGSHAVFAPLGSRLAAVRDWTAQLPGGVEPSSGSVLVVRDPPTGRPVAGLREARGRQPVAWSRDARLVAVGEPGHRLGVWHLQSGSRVGRVLSHIDAVTHAAFTADGTVVTASRDGTLRITDPATARTVRRLEVDGSANPRALAVSPDGRRIVSVWGTAVHLWLPGSNDLTSYTLASVRRSEGWPLCISADCRYMLCRTETGFDIMHLPSGTVVLEQQSDVVVTSAAFSPDGRVLILGRMDGAVEVLDARSK